MCNECNKDWTDRFFSFRENHRESFNLASSLFEKKQNHYVEDGEAFSYKGYDVLITKEHIFINKEEKDLLRLDYNRYNLEGTKHAIDLGIVEKSHQSLMEKSRKFKTWKAIVDNRTCAYCKILNGQEKVEWALFYVNIKGKVYSLKMPPLHWVYNKQKQKIITCRCVLNWNMKREEDRKEKKPKEEPELKEEEPKPSNTKQIQDTEDMNEPEEDTNKPEDKENDKK